MSSNDILNINQFNEIFGTSGGDLNSSNRLRLRSKCDIDNDPADNIASSNRCIYWRYLFGLISSRSTTTWVAELKTSEVEYAVLKNDIFPSITNVGFDPLSENNTESMIYFEKVEKVKSIELDLNRLYITGIDDDYFHTKKRKNILLSVLLIWSVLHPKISYRQGMHEIVGTVLHCLERELQAWTDSNSLQLLPHHFLREAFSIDSIEAHTFWLFSSILESLGVLYDPSLLPNISVVDDNIDPALALGSCSMRNVTKFLKRQDSGIPMAVIYLIEFQAKYLHMLDPELSDHLRENDIHPQFFGLRWSRLLLGREFDFKDTHVLRVWDYLFCSSTMEEAVFKNDHDSNLESSSECAENIIRDDDRDGIVADRKSKARNGPTYCPILVTLRDFMLAMLIHLRTQLLEGDANSILGYLMRFPEMDDLTPIFRIARDVQRFFSIPAEQRDSFIPKRKVPVDFGISASLSNDFLSPSSSSLPPLNRIRKESGPEDILFPPSLTPPPAISSSSGSAGDTILDNTAPQLVALPPSLNTAAVPLESMIVCVLSQPSNPDLNYVKEMSAHVDNDLSTVQNNNPGPAFWQSTLEFSKKLSIPTLGIFQNRVETATEEDGPEGSLKGNLSDREMDSRVDDAQENATSVPFLSPFPCASPLSHSPPVSSSKSSRGRQRSLEETIIVSVTSNIVQNQQMEGCTPLLMEVRLGNETPESLGCGERYNTCDGTVPSLSVKPSGIPDGDCKKADFSPLLSGSPFGLISSTTPTRSSKTGTGSNILSKGSGELLLGSEKAIDMSLEQESTRNILLFPVRKFSASLDFLVSDTRSSAGSDTKGKIIRESNPSAPSSSSHPIRPTDVNFITDGIASTVIKGRNGSTNPSGEVADRLLLLARRLSKQGGITPTVSEHHNEENMRACRKVEGGGPKMSGFDEADFEDTEKAAGSKMQTTLHSEDLNGIGDPPVAEVKYKGATCMSKCPKTVEEQLNEERLLRSDTARRLLMLSSILSGKCSLSEYDDV